jgi:hypothetical protein
LPLAVAEEKSERERGGMERKWKREGADVAS